MKAIRYHEVGGPEVLRFEDVADPTPGPDQVLIEVAAAGVNYADVRNRLTDPRERSRGHRGSGGPRGHPFHPG